MKTLLTCALLATLLQGNHSIAGEATYRLAGLVLQHRSTA